MFSFLIANVAIGTVKALPRVLRKVNAALDLMAGAAKGEERVVANCVLGVTKAEFQALRAAGLADAIERGEQLAATGVRPVKL